LVGEGSGGLARRRAWSGERRSAVDMPGAGCRTVPDVLPLAGRKRSGWTDRRVGVTSKPHACGPGRQRSATLTPSGGQ
jgi:hypothetical protein